MQITFDLRINKYQTDIYFSMIFRVTESFCTQSLSIAIFRTQSIWQS